MVQMHEGTDFISEGRKIVPGACAMCIEECGLYVHVEDDRIVKVEGMPDHPFSEGFLCVSGRAIPEYVHSEARIKHPVKKVNGQWQRITWDEALDTIAARLKHYKETDGAEAVGIFTGDPVNMALRMGYYLIWRWADVYGTPNRFYDGDLCFTPRLRSWFFATGKMCIPDLINSKCIVNWGGNPAVSFPPLFNRMRKAVKNNGATLINIDPRYTATSRQADIFLQPRPGTDYMLGMAMINVIISEELYDKEFVENWTTDFERLSERVKYETPEKAEQVTGVPAEDIRKVARIFATTKPGCINAGMKLEQTTSGWGSAQCVVMLHILTGNIDVPGGGLVKMAGVKEKSYRLKKLMGDKKCVGADDFPIYHQAGITFHEGCMPNWSDLVLKGEPHKMKMLMISGSNPIVSWPNANKTIRALQELEFTVVMDAFWQETCDYADIVLPACTFMERIALCCIYEGHNVPAVMLRRPAIEPLHESMSDANFWLKLARRMGGEFDEYVPWSTDEEAMDYFLSPSGMTTKYLTEEHPTGIITGPDEILFDYHQNGFPTPSGKAELYPQTLLDMGIEPWPEYREPPESPFSTPEVFEEYPIILLTGMRQIEYWHSQQRHCPTLKRRNPEPTAELHKDTAAQYGIADGDPVFIETRRGRIETKAMVTDNILPGVIATHHGWGGKANENLLVDDTPCDPIGGYPPLANQLCRIGKIE
ncbi:MAG: molybdopterin-dependent oxidoreductase [Dehalococcoidia bacterium]